LSMPHCRRSKNEDGHCVVIFYACSRLSTDGQRQYCIPFNAFASSQDIVQRCKSGAHSFQSASCGRGGSRIRLNVKGDPGCSGINRHESASLRPSYPRRICALCEYDFIKAFSPASFFRVKSSRCIALHLHLLAIPLHPE